MKKAFILMIDFYNRGISPYLGARCRFVPSCSYYMKEAIQEWGVVKGVWMGLKRICKCHPFGSSGWDPVPTHER